MWIGIISLFPEIFGPFLNAGVLGRGIKKGIIGVDLWNPRDYSDEPSRSVDDKPYGGGPGMVLKAQPLRDAIKAAKSNKGEDCHVIYLSPQGRQLTQNMLHQFLDKERIILVSGRYEGVDERFIESSGDEEISIGDYVLSGGEVPAMVFVDGLSRLVPGVVGDDMSVENDSFSNGLLEHPQYTRPAIWDGMPVPDILMAGDHIKIDEWKKTQALGRSFERRPDLFGNKRLTEEEKRLFEKYLEISKQERIDR